MKAELFIRMDGDCELSVRVLTTASMEILLQTYLGRPASIVKSELCLNAGQARILASCLGVAAEQADRS